MKFKLYVVLDDNYIYGLHWTKQNVDERALNKSQEELAKILKLDLISYFEEQCEEFKSPIKLLGTTFQLKVWSELVKIPYGTVISYKELAIRVGNINSSRAVGTANSKNPISILIPCHRVIQSSGEYGGYAGGTTAKKRLIDCELGIS